MTLARIPVFIVGAKRTAFGTYGGKLKGLSATDLAVHSSKAAFDHAKLLPEKVDETIFGNVIGSSLDAIYLSRHVALKSGVPVVKPSLTINRLCGSGFDAVCLGTESIILGNSKVVLAGGTENMSASPMVIDGVSARFGVALGKGLQAEDSLWAGLTDSYAKAPMGMTAENVAAKYGVTRKECDEYALRSQTLWRKANDQGIFKAEIAPIELKGRKGMESFEIDEHPRDTKIESLSKLKPVFKEDGVVTAGTASGICDGSGSILLANEEAVKENGLTPLVKVLAWYRVGCDPSIMGIGPVEAIRGALKSANLTLKDMDIIEINEAFAGQYLSVEKELGNDRDKTNLCGGAIALGHPLGTSGARIVVHLTHELKRTGKKYAIGSACIGGGQGIAVILENV